MIYTPFDYWMLVWALTTESVTLRTSRWFDARMQRAAFR